MTKYDANWAETTASTMLQKGHSAPYEGEGMTFSIQAGQRSDREYHDSVYHFVLPDFLARFGVEDLANR
jgi:hypothetical protein